MIVTSIVLITIIVFVLVDLLLRTLLNRAREARELRDRERALESALKFEVDEQAPSLRRAELDRPKARLLAVDDEAVILDSFRKTLVMAGYSIDTVEKGSEALGLIRRNDYDFVFTDLKMPEMDGVEVTRAVKHLRPDIDVIVITGYGSIETAVETIGSGAMDYVQKPFTEDELVEKVKTALIKRQAGLEQKMRHKIHLVRPGAGELKSRFELNVPAGVFVSPQHAWLWIKLDGMVQVGLDDLIRKLFGNIDQVELPENGRKINKGEPLFTLRYGDFRLQVPSPVSGQIVSVNSEHAEHPEWLAIKPFELSWMCGIEPSNLAEELTGLRIGFDSLEWYQQEVDRYTALLGTVADDPARRESKDTEKSQLDADTEKLQLLVGFTKPFLQG